MKTLQELKVYIPTGSDKGSITRKNMPQIDWKHLNDLLIHLKDDYGISHSKKNEDPHKLKAAQSEFSKQGVEQSIGKGVSKSVKPLLVGSDNKIVDGHHRWLAAVNTNVKSLPIIRFNRSASEVIKSIKTFNKVKYRSIYDKNIKQGIQEMKTTDDDDGAKHLVMQLRKVITLAGKKPVEFGDGNSEKVDPNVARKFLQKYMGLNRPAEKEKLQAKAFASYDALKKCLNEDVFPRSAGEKQFLSKVRTLGWSVYVSNKKHRSENDRMYEFEKSGVEFEVVGNDNNWELYDSGPTLSGRGKQFKDLKSAFQAGAKTTMKENNFNKWKSNFSIQESAAAARAAGERDAKQGKVKANASDHWAQYAPDYHKGYESVKKNDLNESKEIHKKLKSMVNMKLPRGEDAGRNAVHAHVTKHIRPHFAKIHGNDYSKAASLVGQHKVPYEATVRSALSGSKGHFYKEDTLNESSRSATDKIWDFMDKAKKHADSGKSSQEFKNTYTKAVNAINKGGSVTAHIDIMKGLMNEGNWAVGKKGWHVGSAAKKDKFKVGDVVVALKGPHKGVKHKIIHVNDDGSYNVAPHELPANKIKYRLGAARSQASDLKPLKENTQVNEISPALATRYLKSAGDRKNPNSTYGKRKKGDIKKAMDRYEYKELARTKGGKVLKDKKKKVNEVLKAVSRLAEASGLYHKTFSDAVSAAVEKAEKQGYIVDTHDISDALSKIPGRGRPSVGKTTIFKIPVVQKGQKKTKYLQIQVYGMESGTFELNSYV